MYALLISLFSSLAVGFYIKQLKISSEKNLFALVLVNYLTAIVLSLSFFKVSYSHFTFSPFYLVLLLLCGILMPSIFLILNKSLKYSGLARTDIFQRMSLIIPVALSFQLFGEEISNAKSIAIFTSFVSIMLLLYKKSTNNGKYSVFYLICVFLGYGTIDTLFKMIAAHKSLDYTSVLTFIFIICAIVSFIYFWFVKGSFDLKFLYLGIVLGILNFSNIYFYMKAHKLFSESPTLVFVTMNLGVIIGGSLIGRYYFKEKLGKSVLLGIFLAVISIILLALVQLKII